MVHRDRLVPALVAFAVTVHVVAATRLATEPWSYGARRFYAIGDLPGRPWVDYTVEYPPLTVLAMKALVSTASDRVAFWHLLVALNLVCGLGIAVLLWRVWGRDAACFFLVAALPLLRVVFGTFDLAPTLLATAAVALWVRGRSGGGAFAALAVLTKLWPFPLLALGLAERGRRRFTIVAGAVGIAGGLVWLAIGGVDGVRQVVTFRGAKGWELGTIPAVFLLAVGRIPFSEAGATRVGEVSDLVRTSLMLLSTGVAIWAILRGVRTGLLGVGWLTATAALLVFSALLSPQFVVWMLPAAAITWVDEDRVLAGSVAAAALLTGVVMERWEWVIEARPGWLLLLQARNLLLVVALVAGLRALAAAPRSPAADRRAASPGRCAEAHRPGQTVRD